MNKIEIKSRFTGEVLFEFTKENNTVKDTLQEAVSKGAYLRYANLEGAYLRYANLEGADLRYANLRYANLEGANLEGADLRGAYLIGTDLEGADLTGAVKVPIHCKWSIGVTDGNLIHIGCEKRTIKEWDEFFNSNEELDTERGTKEFKQIQACYLAYKAYLEFLNK